MGTEYVARHSHACVCGDPIGMQGVVTSAQFEVDGLHRSFGSIPGAEIHAQTQCLKKIQGPPLDDVFDDHEELIFEGSRAWKEMGA